MIFRKRDKRGGAPPHVQAEGDTGDGKPEFFHIDFDMLTKGNVVRRRGGVVKQLGVTVEGSTRLVTSGDMVDRTTYEALLAVGAIHPSFRDRKTARGGEIDPEGQNGNPGQPEG